MKSALAERILRGEVRAAARPLVGRDHVLRLLVGAARKAPPDIRTEIAEVNGGLAVGFMNMGLRTEERNAELVRLNADLEAALAENRELQHRLVTLCAMTPDSHAAPPLTVLGCWAWWRGDGALARAATERALRCDPGYRLAELHHLLISHNVRPPAA